MLATHLISSSFSHTWRAHTSQVARPLLNLQRVVGWAGELRALSNITQCPSIKALALGAGNW